MAGIAADQRTIGVLTDHVQAPITANSRPIPSPSDAANDQKMRQKAMIKAAASMVIIATCGALNSHDRILESPIYDCLSKAHTFLIFVAFTYGMGLLLLSVVLPDLPDWTAEMAAAAARKIIMMCTSFGSLLQLGLMFGTYLDPSVT